MIFPTQRLPHRYPMPRYGNHPDFMRPPSAFRGYAPLSRSTNPGWLQRLLGGAQPQMTNMGSQMGGGLSKTLANVQQVLNVVQSTAPVIQEYAPMVKNLPAMYRMMKAFKDLNMDDESNDSNESDETEGFEDSITVDDSAEESSDELFEEISDDSSDETSIDHSKTKEVDVETKEKKKTGQSIPKLYI
ncbi:VrrA/YqfQ family protein [Oceanobacillus salinisoli]|uniref:VrrA/YqfQ family protein n=1 Tax=Oceanobacillus salinisoli TaxID=2678611 RepID=UPI0018CC6A7F|nr:VrrA/YqfQ family protein [Oceanobacillus salinisoli]